MTVIEQYAYLNITNIHTHFKLKATILNYLKHKKITECMQDYYKDSPPNIQSIFNKVTVCGHATY